ncbi:hypothetical protein OG596_02650 [Streptomyces sp. NBC_01102]|uniref:helix-turn-helix domain-containing protein n=1 Tax=unclassified Streptomyces TaxID=2593676 RepID=UPI00386A38A2|nr:hypothetical protein OG596_02650 [Streptomyces sp. NBC_01102]
MTTTTVNGQIIGQAHYATRAVLESLLARSGTTFHQAVALNATADGDGATKRALTDRMTSTLKIDAETAEAAVDSLIADGLLADTGSRLELTASGRARQDGIRTGTARIAAGLYADLPAEDLAAAGRVLTVLTERANAVLAAG